ncbi:MAG: redoxin domain-containing protein [Clostridiales bacterium]|nr:redoxin domain-containing protein [Clostridiales bacterium]
MIKFFRSIKNWFARHIPTKRRIIQLYVALLYNANLKGFINGEISQSKTKYVCVPGMNCYSCPGAVGACPLGSLQNAFAQSGTRTPYYILGIIGLFGLIFARTVCGFLCPVGLCQELLHKIPSPKIKKSRVTRALSYLKYVILAVLVLAVPLLYGLQGIAVPAFCKYICPAGTFEGGLGLLLNPANQSGSRNLLNMLGAIFTWKFAVLFAFIVLCVFMYRPFCRFFCPLGAIYGFFNKIAFLGVKVDKIKCTDCGLCVKHCQMDVKHVGDHECIHCGRCISVCPVKAISWKGSGLFDKKDDEEKKQPEAPVQELPVVEAAATTATQNNKHTNTNNIAPVFAPNLEVTAVPEVSSVMPTSGESDSNEIEFRSGAPPPKARRKHAKAFWSQLAASCAALIVFASAILYFNVFEKSQGVADMYIGSECPDFTLKKYGEDAWGDYELLSDTFTLSEQLGSVVVINFWATWCGPCVAELPHFNRVANELPEAKIVAIHGSSTEDVARFITKATDTKESWRDYNITFLQDEIEGSVCKTFKALGGNSAWPMTLIVDKEGKITFVRQGSLSYAKLKEEVQKALDKE